VSEPRQVEVLPPADLPPRRLTTGGLLHDQLLYFTSSSLLADDRRLVVIRDEETNPNLVIRDLNAGTDRLLTQNREGALKS
jgi:hypothetical protein